MPKLNRSGATTSWPAFFASIAFALLVALVAFRVTVSTTSGFLAWSDGYAYFLYARSVVIDHDTDLTNEYATLDARYPGRTDTVMDAVRTNAQRHPVTGGIFLPWPPGAGAVLAPFYAAGWVIEQSVARSAGREPDSYGLIPQYGFALGSFAFALLGYWATVACCRRVSDASESTLAGAAAILGGPLVFYVLFSPTMAHSITFGLFALYTLVWWRQWDARATAWGMFFLGLLLGTLATIRFQNLLFGLLPLALVLKEWRGSFGRALRAAAWGAAGAAGPLVLMAVHIKKYVYSTGGAHWLENGSLLIGQYPIDFRSPFFLDVLFSCQHGAYYWSPLLAIGTLGLLFALPRNGWAALVLAMIAIQVWLIGGLGHSLPSGYEVADYSIKDFPGYKAWVAQHGATTWENLWWGGPMFGMRYLSESAHLFAIGFAYLASRSRRVVPLALWSAITIVLVAWNGALIGAYGLNTVSRTSCVTYGQMWDGVGRVVAKVFDRVVHR